MEFSISFEDDRHIYSEEGVACVRVMDNRVIHSKSNSLTGPLINILRETYAEACKKVKEEEKL